MAFTIQQTRANQPDNRKTKKKKSFSVDFFKFQSIKLRDKIVLTKNLQIMLHTGLSLAAALKILTAQTSNKRFQKILVSMKEDIEKGDTFASSLKKFPKVFNELFVSMIESGEASGNLEEVLNYLQSQMKKDHELLSKVRGAMIYPSIVIVAMFGIGTMLMVVVIPKLVGIFSELNADLPAPTKAMIAVSNFFTQQGILAASLIIVVIILVQAAYRSEKGKRFFHRLFLKSPILGPLSHKINTARMARTLASLIKTDLPIIQSLLITSRTLGNVHYKTALNTMSEEIKKGIPIAQTLSHYPALFPPMVGQMITVGEESGQLDNVLIEIAQFYEDDINQTLENLPQIIEPLLIVFLGAGVGAIAVAIIMPLYSLSESI